MVGCSTDISAPAGEAERIDQEIREEFPPPELGSTLRDGRFAVVFSTCDGIPISPSLGAKLYNEVEGPSSVVEEQYGPLVPVEVDSADVTVFEIPTPGVPGTLPDPFTQRLVQVSLAMESGASGTLTVASEDPPAFPEVLVSDYPERRTVPIEGFATC
jgi:hypothetical protein